MTQLFAPSGVVIPVTQVEAGPCPIVQVKTTEKQNANAVQIGFGSQKKYLVKKPQAGHLAGLADCRWLRDFSTDGATAVKRGDLVTVETFKEGEKVQVMGISKGKGFAGVVKRHHFRGHPASHGHKDSQRAPGSIGAGGVQRVFKGMRMAGHMGSDQVTVKNLEIIKIDLENNQLFIKGALPGSRGELVVITAPGELLVKSGVEVKEEVPTIIEEPTVVTAPEVEVEATETTTVVAPSADESNEEAKA